MKWNQAIAVIWAILLLAVSSLSAYSDTKSDLYPAADTLSKQGLADPRGGSYSVIHVAIGNPWDGGGNVITTHGWVLPADKTKPRSAVCWNGLIYPVRSVDAPADLRHDVANAVKDLDARRADYEKIYPGQSYRFAVDTVSEQSGVSFSTVLPMKACLLVRLGYGDLAEELLKSWSEAVQWDAHDPGRGRESLYGELAGDWLWSLFERAVCAHERGDDGLSLTSARMLTDTLPVVEVELSKQGDTRPMNISGKAEGTYFPYLEKLPRLLADEKRRAGESNHAFFCEAIGDPERSEETTHLAHRSPR